MFVYVGPSVGRGDSGIIHYTACVAATTHMYDSSVPKVWELVVVEDVGGICLQMSLQIWKP